MKPASAEGLQQPDAPQENLTSRQKDHRPLRADCLHVQGASTPAELLRCVVTSITVLTATVCTEMAGENVWLLLCKVSWVAVGSSDGAMSMRGRVQDSVSLCSMRLTVLMGFRHLGHSRAGIQSGSWKHTYPRSALRLYTSSGVERFAVVQQACSLYNGCISRSLAHPVPVLIG